MAQQINLCTPIFLTQKRYFSANTMLQALAVFVLLGGSMAAYWLWNLNDFTQTFEASIKTNQAELDRMGSAIKTNKVKSGPADAALERELQSARTELQQREKLLSESQWGLMREGGGHSARLQLVAQTIPAQVWVTEIKADQSRLELKGHTLETAVLNDWVARLAKSPLLEGQALATVKVERQTNSPTWEFTLVSALPGAVPSDSTARAKP